MDENLLKISILRGKYMKKELWFYRFLRWVGLTKAYGIDKKEMCEKAKSVCSENCERCVWH